VVPPVTLRGSVGTEALALLAEDLYKIITSRACDKVSAPDPRKTRRTRAGV